MTVRHQGTTDPGVVDAVCDQVVVLFVRHGQSTWNAARRWQGTADPALTPLGLEQADLQGRSLPAIVETHGLGIVNAWSSPLRRAADTADVLARRLGLGRVRHDARLREASAGEWQGLTPDEISRQWPGYLERGRRPPAFEPDRNVRDRARRAMVDIADDVAARRGDNHADRAVGATAPPDVSNRRTALVVTHSGLLRQLSICSGYGAVTVPNLGGFLTHLVRTDAPERWSVADLVPVEPTPGEAVDDSAECR